MAKAKQKTTKSAKPERHEFQADVSRLLQLMVHSVYSQKEIFLRELISNAADACDKLRYQAITKSKLLGDDPEFKITITLDKKARTLFVSDNGIGMSGTELTENLGTIARSGTRAFLEELDKKKAPDVSQIGQFGVGFYSAFMVADQIDVISHHAGEKDCWHWASDGVGAYTVEQASEKDAKACLRGTQIKLQLNKEADEYLEAQRIEGIVRSYSDHIAMPIELVEIEDGKASEPRQINSARALWTRPKSEISDEQYKEFYGHVGGVFGEPEHIIHYKAEGRHEYSVLLFVPSDKPFDLFEPDRRGRTRLYVKRVFIADDAVILPAYLRFMRGVVDSEDMPLNISREMLQDNPIVAAIGKAVTNRVLTELEKLADKKSDDYAKIWGNFGAVIKEGLYEDLERRDQLLSLARFNTTGAEDQLRSLKDYVAAMPENQTAIYYIAGEDADQIAASPHLEGFKARGIEVLLLSDPVDSFWTTNVLGFDGKPFKSVTQGGADLDQIKPDKKDAKAKDEKTDDPAFGSLIASLKQTLGDKVSEIRKSDRLIDSAVCLVSPEGGMDKGLEKILSQTKEGGFPGVPRIMELNPSHTLIKTLAKQAKNKGTNKELEDAAWLLFDLARIVDGETVDTPNAFAERLSRVMGQALSK